jgi:hypothetical protein
MAVGADVDAGEPIAELEVPAFADVRQIGDTFIALTDRWSYEESSRESSREVRLQVLDLSDPSEPRARGEVELSALFEGYDGYARGYGWDCWGCGGYWWGGSSLTVNPVEGGVALTRLAPQEESLGDYERCWINNNNLPAEGDLPACHELYNIMEGAPVIEEPQACRYVRGGVSCERPAREGEAFACRGELSVCEASYSDERGLEVDAERCAPVEMDMQASATALSRAGECSTYERTRSWSSLELSLISLADLDTPEVTTTLRRPSEERFEGVVASEGRLFYSYHQPVVVEGDELSFVRHFTREINTGDISAPEVGPAVNLPGRFLLKRGDLVVSQDQSWGEGRLESSLNLTRLNAEGTRASLVSRHLFEGRMLTQARLDEVAGEERLVVTHAPSYSAYGYGYYGAVDVEGDVAVGAPSTGSVSAGGIADDVDPETLSHVGVFKLSDLSLLGEAVSDRWANLSAVEGGRAIFSVGGGALIMDLSDPQQISAQAFLPINGWGAVFTLDANTLYAAAGRFGVYTLPLEERLILNPPL